MSKNEWSLGAYSDKDVNGKIISIQEMPHCQQDLTRLLALKEQNEKENFISKPDELLKVLNCRIKKRQEEDLSNLCWCCLEPTSNQKYWCKICGNSTCRKCLVRERELKDQSRTFFCEKCDLTYLRAMDGIQFYNKTEILEKALKRLINEQQAIQNLVNSEREKHISKNTSQSDFASKGAKSTRLIEQNKILKIRCTELGKKLQFGRDIHRQLKRKLHSLRKQQRESFGTMSNHEEYPDLINNSDRDRDELNFSGEHHRESILTTNTERVAVEEDIEYGKKCRCELY